MSETIERNRAAWEVGRATKLSHIIRRPEDTFVVPVQRAGSNFITSGRVQAPALYLDSGYHEASKLVGNIVCLEDADPGYYWIFSCGIARLITRFGVVNSHMAFRSAEFGVPAVIGCGEQLFGSLRSASFIELNCGDKIVRPA